MTRASASGSARHRPARRTSASPGRRCSTGRSPVITAARSSSGSRTPTRLATAEESYDRLLDVMGWLGFDWDEGPGVGGPHAPYRQSQRGDLYADAPRPPPRGRSTPTTATAPTRRSRRAARRPASKIRGLRRLLPRAERRAGGARSAADGRAVVRLPDARGLADLRRPGARRDHLRDPARARLRAVPRQRPDPLYTLVNPVDDALDGDHPRAARRGPALQHAPPARPVRRAPVRPRHRPARLRGSATCPT